MVPQPIGNNRQHQRLTTALKNICRDYPAGGTVLRELLQNADDAGATEVRFVLDERVHPTDQLLDPKLGQYQGPALLAFNNAVFTDKDFESLSRLGDSLKIDDGATTGKFGRGFNSVYNWTDSPSIVSRDRLLILDPHEEWSEGGPVYNLVTEAEDPAIKGQMAAFGAVIEHLDQQLDGTAIRIPLRTKDQAEKSYISKRVTTVSEVTEVLRSFASEFGGSGLLFMRSVERLEITSTDVSIVIEMADREALRAHKSKVNNAIKLALNDPRYSFNHSFHAGIEYRTAGVSTKATFIIHHRIQDDSMDESLRDWSKSQKLIPWVALAARIPLNSTESMKGSLFTVLPLPLPSGQPLHLHGLFSVSPDRAQLHNFADRSSQEQEPAKWNEHLLAGLIPAAWSKLLGYFARLYPTVSAFPIWPQSSDDTRNPLRKAPQNLLELIQKDRLALWPTSIGYLAAEDSLLDTGTESTALKEALREAGAPVVYVPQRFRKGAQQLFRDRTLSPRSICQFIKINPHSVRSWSTETKHTILEYLLSEPGFTGYDGLELFPFKDGVYRSIGDYIAFLHMDKFDEDLFGLDDAHNLDLGKLPIAVQNVLRDGCDKSTIHSSIRYRSSQSLRDYLMSTAFKGVPDTEDMIVLGVEPTKYISKIWDWISARRCNILDEYLSGLWLLPLSNGKHRKLRPCSSTSQIYVPPRGEVGDMMRKFDSQSRQKPLPLLLIGPKGLSWKFESIITQDTAVMSGLALKPGNSLVSILQWLHGNSTLIDRATDEDKFNVSRLLESLVSRPVTAEDRKFAAPLLGDLTIFQEISWGGEGISRKPVLTWAKLGRCKSIGVHDGLSVIPKIANVQFLSATWMSSSKQLLEDFKLADCIGIVRVLENHVLPAWKNGHDRTWTLSCKEQVTELVLSKFSSLSPNLQGELRTLPIIPVSQLNGEETMRFAPAADLIDPSVPELRALCFDNEDVFPKKDLFKKFKFALRECGLKTAVDDSLVEHRINCYASKKHPLLEVRKRAEKLLRSPCRWTSSSQTDQSSKLQSLKWLPTVDSAGTLSLNAAYECRGEIDHLLVSSRLPIVRVPISNDWASRLGWHELIPCRVLISQLQFGVEENDRLIVDAVLAYISQNNLAEKMVNELTSIPCVLISNGSFYEPTRTIRPPKLLDPSCQRLLPYLANVDHKFWEDHKDLLNMLGVGDQLQLADLLNVQSLLEEKPELDESDVAVAIEILNLASGFPRKSLTGLKVINDAGKLCAIHDISHNDLGDLKFKQQMNITHPDILPSTIRKLKIESLRDQMIKGKLEIEEINDGFEFDQRENVTTRIADTLDRYSVEATFKEYLANADDTTGASRMNWLLDNRTHPSKHLITPELKDYQGAALLCFNDGVFTEEDLNGFKNVGEGSKGQDREKIGQFGRGSQTMYHWTDVPFILTGGWLIILDPQRKVLMRNRTNGKRMPGIKMPLSAELREACRDQLAPFEGLWGFNSSLDEYPGTIFRFPLRTEKTKSILKPSERHIRGEDAHKMMIDYFDEARISMLFLRRIRSIDFTVQGESNPQWSITRHASLDEDAKSFSEKVVCSFTKKTTLGTPFTGKDAWWVAIEDLRPSADRLPHSSKRVMKNVECGLAALISSKTDKHESLLSFPKPLEGRMFNTLPLPISADVPVHVHGTFLLSGDRQSIAIDKAGTHSEESKWNVYLLEEALADLYLAFLVEVGKEVRQEVFKFWPAIEPPKRSCSTLLYTSFWELVPESSDQLYPKAQALFNVSQRRRPELFSFEKAVFDFLPTAKSEKFAPLLISSVETLVRNVPPEIAKKLKAIPDVKSITGSRLRQLFKLDRNRKHLQEARKNDPTIMEALLRKLIPKAAELKELDGCHILPLADGNLATLKFHGNEATQATEYYVASQKELQLFDFANKCLVTSAVGEILGLVVESGSFNIATLRPSHVGALLKMRPSISPSDLNPEKWLIDFWKFWNGSIGASSSDVDALDGQLLRAVRDGEVVYTTISQFNQLPGVVEPFTKEHQKLCDRVPGIYRFDVNFLPKTIKDAERSFQKDVSFYKFIRALRLLSNFSGITIEAFVEKHFEVEHVQLLQNLVISHSANIFDRDAENFPGLRSDLMSIALWPRFQNSPTGQRISARNALICADTRLLVPWMREAQRFIPYHLAQDERVKDCLVKLGVQQRSDEQLLQQNVFPLPPSLGESEWEHYLQIIRAVFSNSAQNSFPVILPLLRKNAIAVDGTGRLVRACTLYDHGDQIFLCAFRSQEQTRFLHTAVRGYRTSWLRVGLCQRVNGLLNAVDYIECLRALHQRLTAQNLTLDPYLTQDVQTVLSPLTTPSSSIQQFRADDWETISEQQVFRCRAVNYEPEYRRNSMMAIATSKSLLCLGEVITTNYVPVCWSQTPFATHEPTSEVLTNFPRHGRPTIAMVWKHLDHMKGIAIRITHSQLQAFLADLKSIYQYLQDHLNESIQSFKFSKSAIWLNLDSWDHRTMTLNGLKSSWYTIEELVLSSSCDAGPIKAVRQSLIQYEKLLRALGCNSITYPTVTRGEVHSSCSVAKSLRQFRKDSQLLDITYVTEDREIKAHRLVLATMSPMCASHFSGRWAVEDVIRYDKATDPDNFLSYHTLSTMIQFAYEDDIDWKAMEVTEGDSALEKAKKVSMLLDLHQGADCWLVPALASQAEDRILAAGRQVIDLENVVRIRDRADEVGAKLVKDLCIRFIQANKEAVEKVQRGMGL